MTEDFTVTKTLNASPSTVWKAFSDPKSLAKWWGPKGFEIEVHKLDFKPGGVFHYSMKANNMEIYGKFTYGEIVEPKKITFINSFSDKNGAITRNPWMPTWPLEISNTLTLEKDGDKTKLTLTGAPIKASDIENITFQEGKGGMQQGFKGTFEQLDQFLAA